MFGTVGYSATELKVFEICTIRIQLTVLTFRIELRLSDDQSLQPNRSVVLDCSENGSIKKSYFVIEQTRF